MHTLCTSFQLFDSAHIVHMLFLKKILCTSNIFVHILHHKNVHSVHITFDSDFTYWMCDYRKDYAYFKMYTEEERKNIKRIIAEDQDMIQFNKENCIKERCVCWNSQKEFCPKHKHAIEIMKDGKCKNCKKRNGKRKVTFEEPSMKTLEEKKTKLELIPEKKEVEEKPIV